MAKEQPRIEKIIALCDPVEVIADIGTDHGLIAYGFLEAGKAKKAIATDISKPSLAKAKKRFQGSAYESKVIFRLGSGFSILEAGEANAAVIAGMGGPLIISLLETAENVVRTFSYLMLAPQSYPERVRTYLLTHQYDIMEEHYVMQEEKCYVLMKVAPTETSVSYTTEELLLGRNVKTSPAYFAYLSGKEKETARVLKELEHSPAHKRRAEMHHAYNIYKKALTEENER
ncbi:MAG: tRNA (adenine(22)-N(1))-methyltransferase [Christensenellaceae bacterium]|jgi:tRNA (adenine22-N1)-methyltransferase